MLKSPSFHRIELGDLIYKQMITLKEQKEIQREEFEAKHNLVGFYNLLLQIDKRNNPQLYKKVKPEEPKHIKK